MKNYKEYYPEKYADTDEHTIIKENTPHGGIKNIIHFRILTSNLEKCIINIISKVFCLYISCVYRGFMFVLRCLWTVHE